MNIENIVALIGAIGGIAVPLISVWRLFVRGDNKKRQQQHDLAMTEQKATREEQIAAREAQQAQNALLIKILQSSESSMEAVVGVINTITQVNAKSDLLHEAENTRHIEVISTLNATLSSGLSQNASNLQALTEVLTVFGTNIETQGQTVNQIHEQTIATGKVVESTQQIVDSMDSVVRAELDSIRVTLESLVSGNGNLVTHATIVKIQKLFENKIDAILEAINPSPNNVMEKKPNDTEPITTDAL